MERDAPENRETEISPVEDLMREHGVLHRILLIYGNIVSRLSGEAPFEPYQINSVTQSAAGIAKAFIEEYHQVLEEQYVFPKFQYSPQYLPLTQTLLMQHNAARCLTNSILHQTASLAGGAAERVRLAQLLSLYIRMYDPHTAREDTVIFPALHNLVSEDEFKALGERFEEIEEQKFGENGFQRIVQQVAQLELTLGIYDLNQYTPACL